MLACHPVAPPATPKKILILGGTQFVGRHIAEASIRAGHAVTILNRGLTPDPLAPQVERLRGDRDAGPDGLAALRNRTWDACIDVSGFTPLQVRPALDLLRNRIHRYVFISAVAVYGDPPRGPVTENLPLLAPAPDDVVDLDQEMYGRAKVACENLCNATFADRATILRPQIVAGPHDPSDRYSHWARRVSQPGPILAPGDGSDHVQVIDAADLARFTIRTIEHHIGGIFNLAGPRLTWREFLRAMGARDKDLAWTPASLLQRENITEQQLPLYRQDGGYRSALMHVDSTRAQAAGLVLTEPAATAASIRAHLHDIPSSPVLTPAHERELLQLAAHARD